MSVQRVFWIKQTLKQLDEAAYSGNIGVMELFKFHQKASQKQKDVLQSHIKSPLIILMLLCYYLK